MLEGESRPLLFLLHIPRTGGTGMRKFLTSHLGAERHVPHEWLLNCAMPANPMKGHAEVALISGHFAHGLHECFPNRPHRYVTLLREPVERVLSLWRYLKYQPNHRLHTLRSIRGMSIRRFLSGYAAHSLQFVDGQTRQLVGGWAKATPRLPPSALREALERLESDGFLFGITARFEDSTRLIARELGFEPRWLVGRQNSTVEGDASLRPAAGEGLSAALAADPADISAIRAHNELDSELYRRAEALFQARYERAFALNEMPAAPTLNRPFPAAA